MLQVGRTSSRHTATIIYIKLNKYLTSFKLGNSKYSSLIIFVTGNIKRAPLKEFQRTKDANLLEQV